MCSIASNFSKIDPVVTIKKLRWTNCRYNESVSGRTPPDAVLTNDTHVSVINHSAATIFGSSQTLPASGPLQCVWAQELPPQYSATLASCRRDTTLADLYIT